MRSIVNREISKKDRTIIKCKKCHEKYYDGDVHLCKAVGVEEKVEEKPKVRKVSVKTTKESFKIWRS